MKKKLSILSIVLVVFAILWPLISNPGFPHTHDGQNHLARLANYYLAFRQGQFPPRWAPNLDAGLGYTSLNFNYPLANILAVPMIGINFGIENSLIFLFSISLMLSGVGMYLLLKNKYDHFPSIIGAIAYAINPYQLANIYIRGNIGESMAFGLLPFVLYFSRKVIKGSKKHIRILVIIFAAFLLSHNLLAILSLPFILFLLLLDHKPRSLKSLIKPALISFLLVSFFWIPALFEKQFIVLGDSPLSTANFSSHFPTLDQLLSSKWDHGYSYPVGVDGMGFSLGLLGILGVFLSIPILLAKKHHKKEALLVGMFLLIVYSMTPSSWSIWKLFPILSMIQFPWRLLFFTTVLSSILLAFWANYTKSSKIILLIVLIAVISTTKHKLGFGFNKYSDDHWLGFPLNTTILNENDPIWLDRNAAYQIKGDSPGYATSSAQANIDIISWSGTYREYTVSSLQSTIITEKTIYFPGWQTWVDEKIIDLDKNKERSAGLINYDLSVGEHHIVTRFTQNTPARIVGNTLTIIGLFTLAFYINPKKK